MIELVQKHTVELYNLENKEFVKQTVKARELVNVLRLDVFAKLFYIRYRKTDNDIAVKVYCEHIKAFNPDLKEPGREDKDGYESFISAFEQLINYFEFNDFDESISLIPVSDGGIILDGSHRIAALAYYDKEVTILRFKDVKPVADFDYLYFRKRGLPIYISDKIVVEALNFIDNIYVACLWHKSNVNKDDFATNYLQDHFNVLYSKTISMSLKNLSAFIFEVYKEQDWVGDKSNGFQGAKDKAINCYTRKGKVRFVLFQSSSLNEVQKAKDEMREYYKIGKHSLHVTDNQKETKDIVNIILTEQLVYFTDSINKLSDMISEYKSIVRNVYWLKLKVYVAKILNKVKLYKK